MAAFQIYRSSCVSSIRLATLRTLWCMTLSAERSLVLGKVHKVKKNKLLAFCILHWANPLSNEQQKVEGGFFLYFVSV